MAAAQLFSWDCRSSYPATPWLVLQAMFRSHLHMQGRRRIRRRLPEQQERSPVTVDARRVAGFRAARGGRDLPCCRRDCVKSPMPPSDRFRHTVFLPRLLLVPELNLDFRAAHPLGAAVPPANGVDRHFAQMV